MAKRKGFEIGRRTHRILCSSIFEGKKKKIVFRLSIGKKHYIFFCRWAALLLGKHSLRQKINLPRTITMIEKYVKIHFIKNTNDISK
jgi:hypothetical protein